MGIRKDAWTEEEDQQLKETVLEYVQNGDTKKSAFKKASEMLGRTVSACSYRWNKELKSKLDDPTENSLNEIIDNQTSTKDEISLSSIIEYLSQYKENPIHELVAENDALLKQKNQLTSDQEQLEKRFKKKSDEYEKLLSKYESVAKMFEEIKEDFGNRALH
ncbi:Myb-like DNA-binding domain-containing protein [Cytobacillus sp. FJAT-54145]|uniref:Myb-like DNA-binding domain-containing protein n=1 Tax=Cytobacillus spartinae TaxID=3299023 RepID=A0ABW6KKB5_9BACI